MLATVGAGGLGQEAAARLEARLRPVARRRVLERLPEIQAAARAVRPPAPGARVGLDAGRRLVPVVLDGGAVRDRGAITDAARHPVAPGGLEHPRLGGIGDDERVVVPPGLPVARVAALAVPLEQPRDDPLRLGRGAAALEAEPHEVHAEEARRLQLVARVQRLVADHHAVPLTPPEAQSHHGPAPEHGERLRHLGNRDVLAGQPARRRMREAGRAEERLAFVGRPVAVLGEQRVPVARVRAEHDEGVAARVADRRSTHAPKIPDALVERNFLG